MKSAGLYLGPSNIHLVEADGKHIIKHIQFAVPKSEANILDDKTPEELKIGQLLSEQLKNNPIECKSVHLVIPGKDFIIRTFHMTVLPKNELNDAVRFEAKKYIPFKVEELVADFRTFYDKPNRKNLILFVGIKKDVLAKYTGIATRVNLKVESAEYAGFSAIRLLQQANIKEKDTYAVIYVDPVEEDEVNFVVLENGFPLFSRDIMLSGYIEEGSVRIEKLALADKMDKLKMEIRVSLDYYLRKFPSRNVKKLIFVTPLEYRTELENFVKDRGLASRFVEMSNLVDRTGAFSLGFYKAYAASQAKAVTPTVKVDLMAITMKAKSVHTRPGAVALKMPQLKFSIKYFFVGLLLCGIAFGWGVYKRMPALQEQEAVLSKQPRVAGVMPSAGLDEIRAQNVQYIERIRNIDGILRKHLFLTTELDIIPQVIPEGVWLKNFSFSNKQNTVELVIEGLAYLQDSNKELEAINNFLTKLKENQEFSRTFKEIKMASATQEKVSNTAVTSFIVTCKGTR